MRARGLDPFAGASPLVTGQVVHDHDVTWPEFGHQHLFDEGFEDIAVDGAVHDRRAAHAGDAQCGDQGRGLPMAVRRFVDQSLASRGTAAQASHVCLGPCFIDENQPFGVDRRLLLLPGRATLRHVRTV